jgi:signal transduction histidine kinase/ActR/RegA family two-component response regulator
MTMPARDRVMVLTASGRDSALIIRVLERHRIAADACRSAGELAAALDVAGCAVVAQEALAGDGLATIEAELRRQPPWSDFPFILLAFRPPPGRAASRAWQALGNVTVLDRPTRCRSLLTAVVAALRARQRQFEAEQAIVHRDQFLAMLGHELRNPLAAIALANEAERQKRYAPEAHRDQRGHEIIARQARHLSRLVDDLLDVARVTSGKVVLEAAAIDLNVVIERSVQALAMSARQSAIELATTLWPQPLMVSGDSVRLEEALGHLLSNAIKYSPPKSRVEVSSRAETGAAEITVMDRGLGISAEMLPRVFDLFAQAEVALDRSRGGLGIGLTIVKSLVELHGGSVRAESGGLGQGSTFSVTLPLLDAGAEPASPSTRHLPTGALPLSVLVVEDNDDLLEMTKEVLEGFGCDVAVARDGPSGLERLNQIRPALAFIDIGLPGIDGYTLARRVRSATTGGPWLVALTGYGQPADRERALAAGFNRHLTKPVSVAALRQAVEEASRYSPTGSRPS